MNNILPSITKKEKKQSNGALSIYHLDGIASNNTLHDHRTSLINNHQLLSTQKVSMFMFLDKFSNDDECLELYFSLKFSTKNCEKCGRNILSNYTRMTGKKCFRCRSCHTYIYPLSDTLFRRSTVPLSNIFFAIFMMCCGSYSATGMTGNIPVSYMTTHKLMMLIRTMLYNVMGAKMKGAIEVDEAFIGGGKKMYNWSGISTYKQPIIGLIDRETKQARLFLVPNRSAATIHALIRNNIETGSTIYTDSWRGYNGLSKYYQHEVVDHSKREWVRGGVHTNNIESLWGQFKRNLRKSHIKISDKYIHLYLAEACWRHNSRGIPPMKLFNEILERFSTTD